MKLAYISVGFLTGFTFKKLASGTALATTAGIGYAFGVLTTSDLLASVINVIGSHL